MADTYDYFILGYGVIFGLLIAYGIYLAFLAKKLKRKSKDEN